MDATRSEEGARPGTDEEEITNVEEGSCPGSGVEEITMEVARSEEKSRPGADVEEITNLEDGSRPGSGVEEVTMDVTRSEEEGSRPPADVEEITNVEEGSRPGSDVEEITMEVARSEEKSRPGADVEEITNLEDGSRPGSGVDEITLEVARSEEGSRPGSDVEEITSEVEAEGEWYKALYEEDSKKLMELLEDSDKGAFELWKRGWEKDSERRVRVRKVIETYEGESAFRQVILRRYERHRDYNFLPLDMHPEYLFHFLFARFESVEGDTLDASLANTISVLIITEIADKVSSSSADLLKYLWWMQDGQGRPPLHVAVDEERDVVILLRKALTLTRSALSVADDILRETIRAQDGAGRTALHRAVARGDPRLMSFSGQRVDIVFPLLQEEHSVTPGLLLGVAQTYRSNEFDRGRWTVVFEAFRDCAIHTESSLEEKSTWFSRAGDAYTIGLLELSKKNGLCENVWTNCAPIHSALLHGLVDDWNEVTYKMKWDDPRSFFKDFAVASDGGYKMNEMRWDTGALAMFYFDSSFEYRSTLKKMITKQQDYVKSTGFDKGRSFKISDKAISTAAISVALGRYDALQFLMDCKLDLLEECRGESLLHYATRGLDNSMQHGIDIFTFVSCEHILKDYKKDNKRWEEIFLNYENSFNSDEGLVRRQGCVNMLIQQGCDIFKTNFAGEVPYPRANSKPKFLEWWHEKQLREFQAAQNAQSIASNAISVVAALVATASYVGPLQPPLGYGEDTGGLQLDILAVKVFTICDTMSFYLVIAAIIFALCPCLPMPQQPMLEEFQRTRRTVNIAVALLFPSIICVLVAFAAGSIAVVQTHQTKWTNIVTAAIGGLICLVAFVYFLIRVLAILFHRKPFFKKLYQGFLF